MKTQGWNFFAPESLLTPDGIRVLSPLICGCFLSFPVHNLL